MSIKDAESDLNFLGFILLKNQIKEETFQTI